ncbi:phosphoesterase PA-phosphatase related protein (plasmid) [Gemmatirosa kalamazoonensis]|uniref:Phosphoesterase PA-phosphatase related protein n=1 Tax=Gemmatirosa kalamazoonensis TaxID=861299 RepID=W0RSX3_9BACT|nr:vanadium-dependent haloperoxidase [Gemmatirosa kalamazoonensis]AHG93776.1 phosphoesterase PA-phosphatase related protein [Gemmatirosa kalamazoonensis]
MRRRIRLAAGATLVALGACRHAPATTATRPSDATMLHTAVEQLTNVIVYDIFSPPQASRVYSYASVAAYEAMRAGYPSYRSLAGQLNGLTPPPAPPNGEIDAPLAAVHAFLTVGRQLTFSRQRMDSLRRAMDEQFRGAGLSKAVYERSVAYGDTVAKHVLAWAAKDRYLETRGMPKFSLVTAADRWIPTPPAYMDAVEPNWSRIRPFVLDSASQFRPEPPLAFDTTKGSPYWTQVLEVYATRRRLTEEQRAIAAFWDCNPYVMHVQGHTMFATKKVTPGGHWMSIVGIAARKAGADPMQSASAYVRTAVALSDGFLAVWDEKYRSARIRPETVIAKYVDGAWEPLLQTPPFPEYTSGHSGISTAAAAVLTDEFGPGFAFADSAEVAYGLPVRAFPSFEAAAAEAAISRLYGGIHFRQAIEQGVVQGRRIGQLVVARVRTHDRVIARR